MTDQTAEAGYKVRARAELVELQSRIQGLEAFLGTDTFKGIPELEKFDLEMQLRAMEQYRIALQNRVDRFDGKR